VEDLVAEQTEHIRYVQLDHGCGACLHALIAALP
jgi:hypothetical protein